MLLRDRTAAAHDAAEEAMGVDFRSTDSSQYLALLNGLLEFHDAVAEFSWSTVAHELEQDMAALVRVQSLRADISVMSARSPNSADDTTRADDRPAVASVMKKQLHGGRDARIGAAYVAAGSVLGGRVIAASLAAGSCSDFPRSFFASEGLDLGRLWHQFKAALDVFGKSGADTAQVIAGAIAAFSSVHDILSAPGTTAGTSR
ncbi:MAG: biliverdin-producing heme oxygenase [Mycolicibacterium sp.]|uniref:biliverdin-producing heme oxygenase n=1 Tax=Mycolicibacterium sp. TaxID=2320850 RepID=UPI003D0D1C48